VNDHPTYEELEGFVWNRVTAERARQVAAHLIRGCARCARAITPHLEGLFGLADPPERVLSPREEAQYDAALDRAFAVFKRQPGELRARKHREGLSVSLDAAVEESVASTAHLRGVPLLETLLERSWSLRYENPEEMVRHAESASEIAAGLDPEEVGERRAADLRCRSLIELGNACRVADDLARAEGVLGEAAKVFLQGTQDDALAARLFDIQASLYGDQRRFDLAQSALDMVYAIHRRRGDRHLAGRALISKAVFIAYEGESEEAMRLVTRGLELVDEARDPQLVFLAARNLAYLLVDCGRYREARIALFKLRSRGLVPCGRVTELRLRWVEGRINAGLGDLDRAEQALLEVKEGFEEAHLGYKAALVGLELGAVMLKQGRTDEAKRAIVEAADVFMALGIGRETAASVLLLRKAFEKEMLDAVLLEHVIALLHRAEQAPERPGRE
jgi:tetratricopeptide (TPR) repeat protein